MNQWTHPGMTRRQFLFISSMAAAGFVTGCATNPVTGESQLMLVSEQQAFSMCRRIAREEGILVGISSGAVAHAMLEIVE